MAEQSRRSWRNGYYDWLTWPNKVDALGVMVITTGLVYMAEQSRRSWRNGYYDWFTWPNKVDALGVMVITTG